MKTLITLVAGVLLASSVAGQSLIFKADDTSTLTVGTSDTRSLFVADLDQDGDQDMLVINYAQPNLLLENRGDGVLESVLSTGITGISENSYGAAGGDIDGDGDIDLAIANGGGQDNSLFRNNGPPSDSWANRFTNMLLDAVSQGGGDSYAPLFLDVDGDGDLDLAFANRGEPNFVYRNNGSGSFTQDAVGPVVTDEASSRGLASGDLDGDGDADLVFANSNDEANFVYLNQGGVQGGTQGDFLGLTGDPATTSTSKSFGVSLADWDGDGDLDLFVANRKNQTNELFNNGGSGAFSLAAGQAPSQAAGDSFAGTFGDADGDGDIDLFVANRNQANFFYVNDGASLVSRGNGPVVLGADDSRLGIFADLDNDGSVELAVANTNSQPNDLFRSLLSRWVNLGSAWQPVPGSIEPSLSAGGDLSGHSWVHYFVDTDVSTSSITLVVGLAQIDLAFRGGVLVPAPDLLVEGFSTNASGHLRMSFIIPDILPPELDLYHQVWIVDGSAPGGLVATNGLRGTTP
ncbi:MAG: hypothetical protein DRQ55_03205 [Planctomycetota bacterium]|nr:MAG: hypothetical protein DRQ55_03205 [Planctomycetota bacterium]